MRNKQNRNIISRISILILTFIFIGSLLFEPIHYFLISHESKTITTPKSQSTVTKTSYDCPICKFHFCSFINGTPLFKEILVIILNYKIKFPFKNHLIPISLTYKKGRAPPFLMLKKTDKLELKYF